MTTAVAPARGAPSARPARTDRALRWRRRAPLLPALVFLIVVTQLPFLTTVVISFTNWNILRPGQRDFAAFGNYVTVFTDGRLRAAAANTVVLTSSVVLVSLLLGLVLALLLHRTFRGRGLARTLLIAPFLVMPMASALLWKHALYNPSYGLLNGIMNAFGQTFGFRAPVVDWISSMPMSAVVASLVWQWTPFMMLIILAGLQGQSPEVKEAASVDGADALATFRHITLPNLRRFLELAILLGSIYVVQTFDAVFSITQGGPGTATTNLPYEIYLTMFRKYEYGEAAAAGVVVVIGTIIVATFALRVVSSLFTEESSS